MCVRIRTGKHTQVCTYTYVHRGRAVADTRCLEAKLLLMGQRDRELHAEVSYQRSHRYLRYQRYLGYLHRGRATRARALDAQVCVYVYAQVSRAKSLKAQRCQWVREEQAAQEVPALVVRTGT